MHVGESSRVGRWSFIGRAVVTLTILVYLLSRVPLGHCGEAITRALGIWLAVAFIAYALVIIASVLKWDAMLRGLRIAAPKSMLLKTYLIGLFMNAWLPGVAGGDLVRCQLAGPTAGGRLKVAASVHS